MRKKILIGILVILIVFGALSSLTGYTKFVFRSERFYSRGMVSVTDDCITYGLKMGDIEFFKLHVIEDSCEIVSEFPVF
jgi:hypothetical protein